jgi:hypothetical protein
MYLIWLAIFRIGRREAYKRGRYRHRPPLVPSLNNRRIDTTNRIWQIVKITCEQSMTWEVFPQDIKELHQSRRNVFGVTQIRREG